MGYTNNNQNNITYNQYTWQVLSILVAITSVLIIPTFLIFDSIPCQLLNQICYVNLGSFLLVVSCSLYISVVIITQCIDAPNMLWMFENENDNDNNFVNNVEGIMEAYYTDNSIDDIISGNSVGNIPNNNDINNDEENNNNNCYIYNNQKIMMK